MNIDNLEYEELIELNKKVVKRLKFLYTRRCEDATCAFQVGQTVEWKGKIGNVERGSIIKINRKSIKIRSTSNLIWNVSPTLLSNIR